MIQVVPEVVFIGSIPVSCPGIEISKKGITFDLQSQPQPFVLNITQDINSILCCTIGDDCSFGQRLKGHYIFIHSKTKQLTGSITPSDHAFDPHSADEDIKYIAFKLPLKCKILQIALVLAKCSRTSTISAFEAVARLLSISFASSSRVVGDDGSNDQTYSNRIETSGSNDDGIDTDANSQNRSPVLFNRTRNVAERGTSVAADHSSVASGSGSFSRQDFLPTINHELDYSGSSFNCTVEGENCDKKPVIGTDQGVKEERNGNSLTPPTNFVIDRDGSGDQFIEEVPVKKELIKRPLIEVSSSEEDGAGDDEDEESKPDLKRLKIATFGAHSDSASRSELQSSSKDDDDESEIIYFGSIECRYKEIEFAETKILIWLSKVENSKCSLHLEVPVTQITRMETASRYRVITMLPRRHLSKKIHKKLLKVDPSLFEYIGTNLYAERYITIKTPLDNYTTPLQMSKKNDIDLNQLRNLLFQVNASRNTYFGKPFLKNVMPMVTKKYEETLISMTSNILYIGLHECHYQEIKFKDAHLVILLSKIGSVGCIKTLKFPYSYLYSATFVSNYSAFTIAVDEKYLDKLMNHVGNPSVMCQLRSNKLSKLSIKTNHPIDEAFVNEITQKVPQFPKEHISVTDYARFKLEITDLSEQRMKYFKKPMLL